MTEIVGLFISLVVTVTLIHSENSINIDNDQLIFAHVIFRHGDRSAVHPYPNDPYNSKEYWPEGNGHLTKAGKLREFMLGKYLRRRYSNLLGDGRYSPDKVYVRSSYKDRTLISAAAALAGLFPPEKDQIWNDEIPNWLPIPIHTIPEELDHIVASERPCPRYKKAFHDQLGSPEYMALLESAREHIDVIKDRSGFKNISFWETYFVWDTLNVQSNVNLTSPNWSEKMMAPNSTFQNFILYLHGIASATKEMQKLQSGFLLLEMLERFEMKSESKLNPDRSLYIYSGHDLTIINILNSFNLFSPQIPPFGSSIYLELYKTNENKFYVQLYYRNTTAESFPPLNIPGCGNKCSLDELREVLKDVLPTEDFETECKLPVESSPEDETTWKNDLIFPICCTIIILLSTMYGWRKQTISDFK